MNADRAPTFELPRDFVEEHLIPLEVKRELKKQLDSPQKDLAARKGRTFAATIMGRNDYKEVSLENVPLPEINETLLGPDSIVDKQLLGFALKTIDDDSSGAVFLATHDGGIQTEVSVLQTKLGKHIFTPVTRDKLVTFLREYEINRLYEREITFREAKAKESSRREAFKGLTVFIIGIGMLSLSVVLPRSGIAYGGMAIFFLATVVGLQHWLSNK